MKMPVEPDIDLSAPYPGMNGGKGLLEMVRVLGGARNGQHWHCVCGQCGKSECRNHNTRDQAIAIRNLKRRGWVGFGKAIRCAACAAARKPAAPPCPVPALPVVPPVPERQTMSDAAQPDIIRAARVAQYLEVYWRDGDGRYDDGWTDERVGRELGGIAPDFVRRVREGLGKMPKRPAEIVEAERRLGALETDLTVMEGQVLARVKALRADLDACRALIAQADARTGKVAA